MPMRTVIAVLLVLLTVGTPSQGQVNAKYPAAVRFKADLPDRNGRQTVTAVLILEDGWVAIADPAGNEVLQGMEVTLTSKDKERFNRLSVAYPPGEVVKDADFGDYRIYHGTAVVQAVLERREGDLGPAELTLYVRPFNFQLHRCIPGKRFTWTTP
jgi:hypothetical protein